MNISHSRKREAKPTNERSVAQKYIKHFISLGRPFVMLMYALYNVNPLLQENTINDLFFKSMFNSFEQAVIF
jgi:hypothetical protein